MTFFLVVLLGLLPGVALVLWGRGPRSVPPASGGQPPSSLAAAAVLRDGAVGATRWAFAALICRLARDGHCTLGRTQKRRWWRPSAVATVDLHADPTALTALEQTVLRQLGRHDTLDGFGFSGSTFRRRTLRDVRAALVARGRLADRSRRSTVCALAGGALLTASGLGGAAGLPVLWSAAGLGGGLGGLLAATVRYPLTAAGARRRAAHRAHAERRHEQIDRGVDEAPARAAALLREALPVLVLERLATPRWLAAVADRLDAAEGEIDAPGWVRDEGPAGASFADACRTLAAVLQALGARTPLLARLRPQNPGP
jgi:hypothetical protein